jgi:hypothetical protein
MKKRLIISTLMVLFLGTIALAQTIYSPSNGQVIEIPAGPATTVNVPIYYDNSGNGNLSGDFNYHIYIDGHLEKIGTTSPIPLTIGAGTHTVKVEYFERFNSTSIWVLVRSYSVTFTVAKTPTIVVSGPGSASVNGQTVTFTAEWDTYPYHSYSDVGWDLRIDLGPTWITNVGSGAYISVWYHGGTELSAKAWIYFNGRKVYSNEKVVFGK